MKIFILREELAEKTPVAVSEDERVSGVLKLAKKMSACALQKGPEGKIFGPAVKASYAVEVCVHRTTRRKSSGVRRAKSAAARRFRGEIFVRRWLRARSKMVLTAQAAEIGHTDTLAERKGFGVKLPKARKAV